MPKLRSRHAWHQQTRDGTGLYRSEECFFQTLSETGFWHETKLNAGSRWIAARYSYVALSLRLEAYVWPDVEYTCNSCSEFQDGCRSSRAQVVDACATGR